jgi:aldose sugar dehydrogenase
VIILFLILLCFSSAEAQTVNDPRLQVRELVSGLSNPTAMAFIGANDILVLQKNDGRVRRVVDGVLQAGEVLDLAVDTQSERGLLGIALHPNFASNGFVYLYYTQSSTAGDTSGSALDNRVFRYIWDGGKLISPTEIILLPVTAGPNHNGGTITFGPDGKLYIVIGDLNRTGQLQNFAAGAAPDDTGVILRLNDDGTVPSDNPFFSQGGNLAKYYAYGIRNSFGMAFDSVTGELWMTENGPASYDEINQVLPGFNSGWAQIMGPESRSPQDVDDLFVVPGSHYADPKFSWFTPVGPTAIVFLNSTQLGSQYQNDAFVGDINHGRLYRFKLNPARDGFIVESELADLVADSDGELSDVIIGTGFGGITDLKVDQDGFLYVLSYTTGRILVVSGKPAVGFESVSISAGQVSVIIGGVETSGLSRGPAFQLFNTSGTLEATQFALNPDFRVDFEIVTGNFDADSADEVLAGGRENLGLMRGPAYQLFDTNGAFIFTRFVLNPDFAGVSFSPFNVGSNGVLVCGREIVGLSRGPAYQVFDASGNLVRTQFGLNTDFTMDNGCLGSNLDGVDGDEVILFGREVTGAGRGPALQAFNSNGSLRFTRFVLNNNFIETKFTVGDVLSPEIIVYGRETSGASRGPAFQTFDGDGNLVLTRFILNSDFTDVHVFGANITSAVSGEEIVTGGTESSGLARGPAAQVFDKNGNHLWTRFVLNPDFTEVKFGKIDINNDGVDEIIVVGRETAGLRRGPAFQVFDGGGDLLLTRFVLNSDFTNIRFFATDQNGDGNKEIGVGGVESSGLMRGPAYQIFESNGTLLQTRFVLNPDF